VQPCNRGSGRLVDVILSASGQPPQEDGIAIMVLGCEVDVEAMAVYGGADLDSYTLFFHLVSLE
jgi:hypothetical protein